MDCDVPVTLMTADVLLPQLIPALLLLGVGVMVCLFAPITRRRKVIVLVVTAVLAVIMSTSTLLLANKSSVRVHEGVLTVQAGFWKAEAPLSGVQLEPVPNQRLVKRTNGMSAERVRAGWFTAADGRRTFALFEGDARVTLRTDADLDITLDDKAFAQLKTCLAIE